MKTLLLWLGGILLALGAIWGLTANQLALFKVFGPAFVTGQAIVTTFPLQ